MQRLFSTFPGSWPGLGLLLLRVTLGAVPLVGLADPMAAGMIGPDSFGLPVLALLLACILAGLGTPVASGLLAVTVVVLGRGLVLPAWLMAGGSLSLMLLGPGAWSLDAWIYGRKRIRLGDD